MSKIAANVTETMAESTQLYRQIMAQLEAKRIELGLPMSGERKTDGRKSLDNLAGVADGYYSKAICPDTPSGRRAGWSVLDEFVIALFGRDFEVKITGAGLPTSALGEGRNVDVRYLQRRHWRSHKFYRELGASGGKATSDKYGSEHMRKIGRKGARSRKKARNKGRLDERIAARNLPSSVALKTPAKVT